MFRYSSLLLSCCVFLGACSTIVDGSMQNIRVETPGSKDSICYLENEHARYKVVPPQTIKITKFKKPFKVNCLASGDRKKSVDIDPTLSESAYYNIANGGIPGLIIDDNANSMYESPDLIVVDFTGMKPNMYPLPDYQHDLLQNPTLFQYEEFRAGIPALQSDVYKEHYELQRTDRAISEDSLDVITPSSSSGGGSSNNSSSSSGGSADSLTRSMNPDVFYGGSGGARNAPAPLK